MLSIFKKVKDMLIGKALSPLDRNVFQHVSLIAFFAWVGLGADGLSSSCYGPEEAFLALGTHKYLSLFVALATGLTVLLISSSYSQLIELFPTGGGGYLVASKLLSPSLGMISGCALLIDYVLTIAISIASGADALFSFFPNSLYPYKLHFAIFALCALILLNSRGVKESVLPLVPIFMVFLLTHVFVILNTLFFHLSDCSLIFQSTVKEIRFTQEELGLGGMIFIMLRAYSLGAGTYTGIEAVSNGLPYLREPKVLTGKRTMQYMSFSLAFMVVGLMMAYLLFNVSHQPGKTLNATLFENITMSWPSPWGNIFVYVTLISEACILFVAAQAGFLGGPRVLANMALDRWFPTRFASLSDRLVTQNGVLLMGITAIIIMIYTLGSVKVLVVLYSINVFITFFFSQLGMVKHWIKNREKVEKWAKKILISGTGLLLTTFILLSVISLKFHDGGWVTLMITGSLIVIAVIIKRHYIRTARLLNRLNDLVQTAAKTLSQTPSGEKKDCRFDNEGKTAVLLVNGFNGLGLHTLFNIIRFFGNEFKNFIFIEVGVIDAGNFKGAEEVDRLKEQSQKDIARYVEYMNQNGYYAEGISAVGIDAIEEIEKIAEDVLTRYPGAVFFGGQLVFPEESFWTRWLHNNTVFSIQRRFYQKGTPFVILPIRV